MAAIWTTSSSAEADSFGVAVCALSGFGNQYLVVHEVTVQAQPAYFGAQAVLFLGNSFLAGSFSPAGDTAGGSPPIMVGPGIAMGVYFSGLVAQSLAVATFVYERTYDVSRGKTTTIEIS